MVSSVNLIVILVIVDTTLLICLYIIIRPNTPNHGANMTSVICWKNENSLWIVSDSRINQSASSVLNNLSPKIFTLPVKVGFNEDPWLAPIEISTVGFSFSGNTLIANITKDLLQLLLSNLKLMNHDTNNFSTKSILEEQLSKKIDQTKKSNISKEIFHIATSKLIENNYSYLDEKPSLEEIANLAKDILTQTIISYYNPFNMSGSEPSVEILIFGYCEKNLRNESFKLRYTPEMTSPEEIKCIQHSFDSEEYCILGDRIEYVREKIQTKRVQTKNRLVSDRAPLYVLNEIIDSEQKSGSIGGHLQLAVCGENGVHIKGFTDDQLNFSFCGVNPYFREDGTTILRALGKFVILPPVMVYPSEKDE